MATPHLAKSSPLAERRRLVNVCVNGLGITQITADSVVVLKDDVRARERDPTGLPGFDRTIKHVVDLDDAEVGEESIGTRNIADQITLTTNVASSGAVLKWSVGRTAPFVFNGPMIYAVVWAGSKLPDVVRNLDCKTVVKIPRQDKHWLFEGVPRLDEPFAISQEDRPGIVFFGCGI